MSLLDDLIAYREECVHERDMAADPGPYQQDSYYDYCNGKEMAYDDVIYKLDQLIKAHS